MAQALQTDLRELVLSNQGFGPQEIDQLSRSIAGDAAQLMVLRDIVGELEQMPDRSPALSTKMGVCQYLLGRYHDCDETLAKADGGALALFYRGRAYFQVSYYPQALDCYEAARRSGYNDDICNLAVAEVHRYAERPQEAMQILDNMFGPIEQTSEYLYQRGATVAACRGNASETITLYERAVHNDPAHAGALFGLALENERRGNDEEALRLYERAASQLPAHVGTLLNLGILYEDRNEYNKAQLCYKRILEVFPSHPQARLYIKDAAASGSLYFDEESQKRSERMTHLLSLPVSDFELSVRSRNCLQKMGIKTLGDLSRTTEQSLLASKNFGETSLLEIRDMLQAKGLSLGQFAHEKVERDPPMDVSHMSPDQQAVMDRPISDLNLSVRARKCMVRLGINTIGELIRKTGDEMLECKNFGVTSLTEVREKLTGLNLKLRGD